MQKIIIHGLQISLPQFCPFFLCINPTHIEEKFGHGSFQLLSGISIVIATKDNFSHMKIILMKRWIGFVNYFVTLTEILILLTLFQYLKYFSLPQFCPFFLRINPTHIEEKFGHGSFQLLSGISIVIATKDNFSHMKIILMKRWIGFVNYFVTLTEILILLTLFQYLK